MDKQKGFKNTIDIFTFILSNQPCFISNVIQIGRHPGVDSILASSITAIEIIRSDTNEHSINYQWSSKIGLKNLIQPPSFHLPLLLTPQKVFPTSPAHTLFSLTYMFKLLHSSNPTNGTCTALRLRESRPHRRELPQPATVATAPSGTSY